MREFYWVRRRNGDWLVTEKRNGGWFLCGEAYIQPFMDLSHYRTIKNPDDIVEIGDRVECPHT